MKTYLFTIEHPQLYNGAKYSLYKSRKGMQRVADEDLSDWVDDQINYFKLNVKMRHSWQVELYDEEFHEKLIKLT